MKKRYRLKQINLSINKPGGSDSYDSNCCPSEKYFIYDLNLAYQFNSIPGGVSSPSVITSLTASFKVKSNVDIPYPLIRGTIRGYLINANNNYLDIGPASSLYNYPPFVANVSVLDMYNQWIGPILNQFPLVYPFRLIVYDQNGNWSNTITVIPPGTIPYSYQYYGAGGLGVRNF